MSVPNRRESAALYLSLRPPAWHLNHSRAVAETAAWLALRVESAGCRVDRRLVESAALLHDVGKLDAVKPAVAGFDHALGAVEWLAVRGYAELGPVIAEHPVTRLADGNWFERWMATASIEALIVSYADKRAGQRLETMAERFASWERRYPPEVRTARPRGSWHAPTVAAVRTRAEEIERRVCEVGCVSPAQVTRLAWTKRAMRAIARGLAA